MIRLVALLAVSLALVAAPPSVARADQTTEARRLFEQASRARDAGHWSEARSLLERSLAASPRFSTAWNLATALERTDDTVGALELLLDVQAGRHGPVTDAERASLAERVAELSRHVGTVVVVVDAPGADVRVGDRPPVRADASGRATVRVEPGALPISVADHGRRATRRVDVGAGTVHEIEIALPPPIEGPRQASAPRPRRRAEGGPSPWIWVAVGAAVVAGGALAVGLAAGGGEDEPVDADFVAPAI